MAVSFIGGGLFHTDVCVIGIQQRIVKKKLIYIFFESIESALFVDSKGNTILAFQKCV